MGQVEGGSGADRLERLANLVLYLLHAERPVTIHEICDQVAGYSPEGDPAALRQRFERDKKILRDEGIVIHVEPVANETQLGYRIREQDYFLPDLDLTADEQSALSIAVAGVHIDDSSSRDALAKLGISLSSMPGMLANIPAEPRLAVLHQAVRTRSTASFTYHQVERTVDPYGLLCRGGAWYLFGWDHTRSERRTYRVDRLESPVSLGEAGTFEPPADFDPSAALPEQPWSIGEGEATKVRLAIDAILAPTVAGMVGPDHVVEREPGGGVSVELDVVNRDALRAWVLAMGEHARVTGPADVQHALTDWLDRIIDGQAQ